MSTNLSPRRPASIAPRKRAAALAFAFGAFGAFGAASALAATIHFDGLADGTNINTLYPGVTFVQPTTGGSIYARSSTAARSPANVVSIFATGLPPFRAFDGAVDAVFATPQRSVSIDAAPIVAPEGLGTVLNRPFLQAFDAAGNVLATVYYAGALPGVGGLGPYETIAYTSPTANIARVRWSVQQGNPGPFVYGYFDNFSYSTLSNPQAQMYDDFAPAKWTQTTTGTGVTIRQQNNRLEMQIAANASGSSISGKWDSTCQLRGDFDLRVDWSLPGYVPRSSVRLALAAGDASIERTGLSANDFFTTGDYYIQQVAGVYPGFVSTTDQSGKLRITRTGSTYRTFFQNSAGAWVQTAEGTGWFSGTGDVGFSLSAFTGQPAFVQQKVVVRFDNVLVQTGQLVGTGCN
jgi:hypothetical protein